jgi:hypothetical protein
MHVKKQQLEPDWFQIGKQYVKAVFCHPFYLTYMQSTSSVYKEITLEINVH